VSENPEEVFIKDFKVSHDAAIEAAMVLRNQRVSITVKKEKLLETAKALKEEFEFTIPISAGALDYPKDNLMEMIYYLMNPSSKLILTLRTRIPRDDLIIQSMTPVWEAMSFHERETYEMFGIEFKEHDNLIPLLLPPDWRGGFPLRKDFKGEGVPE
jgi:NADH-quinone oxidoreductase subunit C